MCAYSIENAVVTGNGVNSNFRRSTRSNISKKSFTQIL